MAQPFFRVDRLTKRFGGLTAVNSVSFELKRDQIVGLIGPNGAGKTTLLRLITKILKPDAGSIELNGEDLTGMRPWEVVERGIAGTFQNTRPFRHLPIVANVMVPLVAPRARRSGEWVKRVEAKAMDALEFVGISDMALEPASALSQGDLKRLEVARAIATEPELLLLDEPAAGLDTGESWVLGQRLRGLLDHGITMLLIDHDIDLMLEVCDHVYVLDFGRLIASGPPAHIRIDPAVVSAYLGSRSISPGAHDA
jgi:branched-chain amino acid transport system ATP-binding protein